MSWITEDRQMNSGTVDKMNGELEVKYMHKYWTGSRAEQLMHTFTGAIVLMCKMDKAHC
jgi:hypothetical protein